MKNKPARGQEDCGLPWILWVQEHIICSHSHLGLANSSFKILSQDKITERKLGGSGAHL